MFNINKLQRPSCMIFAGSSKSGKSYLVRSILNNIFLRKKDGFKFGLVFTGTRFNSDYTAFLPEKFVIEQYSQEPLENFLNLLKQEYSPILEQNEEKGKKKNTGIPHSFIVFDDIVSQINQRAPFFQNFISTYRHFNITLFFTTQYIYQVLPLIRQQADYAFIFGHDAKRSLDALYESFGGSFETSKDFKLFLQQHTSQRYHCLVYSKDEHERTKKYQEYVAPATMQKVKFNY